MAANGRRLRWWLARSIVLVLAGTGLAYSGTAADRPPVARAAAAGAADIVWIVVDDARLDALSSLPSVRTLLSAHGARFTAATVSNPLCCPSRSSMLTGRYSHHTGVWLNEGTRGGFHSFPDSATVATSLDAAGYRTALIGKYLNDYDTPSYVPPGWDEWAAFVQHDLFNYSLSVNGTLQQYGNAPADYSTDVLASKAVSFVSSTPADSPLFLYLAPFAPHLPATPAPRDAQTPASLPRYRPPSFNQADVTDKPGWVRSKARLTPEAVADIDATRLDMVRSLGAVDDMVARVVAALEASGRLNRTLIAFTSDNGYHWGEHRLREKGSPYEEAIRVPLVIRYDPLTSTARTDARLVQNVDLAPTAAQLAGGTLSAPVDGASLLPLLAGEDPGWRSWSLLEHYGGSVPSYCGLRTSRWKCVRYPGTGEQELYDLSRDPYELTNVSGQPAQARRQQNFRSLLAGKCALPLRFVPASTADDA